MKKLLLVLILLVGAGGALYAAQTDTFVISVNIIGTGKSVLIVEASTNTYASINATVVYSSITVQNDSGGLTEDYQIKASTGLGNWTLSADVTPGPNEAVLQALVKAQSSTTGTFDTDDVVTFAYQDCGASIFGDGATNGSGVANGAYRSLLLQLKTPTSVNQTTENITLTINVK